MVEEQQVKPNVFLQESKRAAASSAKQPAASEHPHGVGGGKVGLELMLRP